MNKQCCNFLKTQNQNLDSFFAPAQSSEMEATLIERGKKQQFYTNAKKKN